MQSQHPPQPSFRHDSPHRPPLPSPDPTALVAPSAPVPLNFISTNHPPSLSPLARARATDPFRPPPPGMFPVQHAQYSTSDPPASAQLALRNVYFRGLPVSLYVPAVLIGTRQSSVAIPWNEPVRSRHPSASIQQTTHLPIAFLDRPIPLPHPCRRSSPSPSPRPPGVHCCRGRRTSLPFEFHHG